MHKAREVKPTGEFCINCGQQLKNDGEITYSTGFVSSRAVSLMYCVNRECNRFGLYSALFRFQPKEVEQER